MNMVSVLGHTAVQLLAMVVAGHFSFLIWRRYSHKSFWLVLAITWIVIALRRIGIAGEQLHWNLPYLLRFLATEGQSLIATIILCVIGLAYYMTFRHFKEKAEQIAALEAEIMNNPKRNGNT